MMKHQPQPFSFSQSINIPLIQPLHDLLLVNHAFSQLISEGQPSRAGVVFPPKQFQLASSGTRSDPLDEHVDLVWLA